MFPGGNMGGTKTTSPGVVIPFYIYAGLSFLFATILLILKSNSFDGHYFDPDVLTITHIMALGWGTMVILGASHQLVPVVIEGKLYSNKLAYASFAFAAVGIPLLCYGFYAFDMGVPARWGGSLIVIAIILYTINLLASISKGKSENVHGLFIFAAAFWLFVTASLGLLLVFNFNDPFLPRSSLHYLTLHSHLGIIGWFLLLVMGVGSRLIPMFMISKYSKPKHLYSIFFLVNTGLLLFILSFFFYENNLVLLVPTITVLVAIIWFGLYCYRAYKERIRKQVDDQVKISLLSAAMMSLPMLLLIAMIVIISMTSDQPNNIALTYGFTIFFGWLTAIILGMTFKTLPFIVWNKLYHVRAGTGKTTNPKDMYSAIIIKLMSVAYLCGFFIFAAGIITTHNLLLKTGAVLLLLAAVFYVLNMMKILLHKPD